MSKEKILITSGLPYANGPLHFGHIAGAHLPADCYARFHRLMGHDVLYISGTDEYGFPITLSAEEEGHSPKEHVDIYYGVIFDLFQKLEISFDHFSRTTWEGHIEPVQQFFLDLFENGYIEEKVTNQLYSEKEKRFLADRYVIGTCPKCHFEEARGDECTKCGANFEATDLLHPKSKMTKSPLILKPTKHWFLRFDKFKDRLLNWIKEKDWKPNVLNFSKAFIQDLKPRAITRDSTWGVPVPLPDAEGKVLYVWFDAPIGYISSTMEWAQKQGDSSLWERYWLDPKTKLVNFIGKDNIPFHAIFFPAMVMGQDMPYKLVDELPANEFYNLEGRQFSKSLGWYVDLAEFLKKYTADQLRYVLAANAPENHDSEFTWDDFQARSNADLLGKYGNLANRILVFAKNHTEGLAPNFANFEEEDQTFLEKLEEKIQEIQKTYETFQLRKAAALVMELASLGNAYFDHKKPWVLSKSQETYTEMETTISCCLYCLKLLAMSSYPIMPTTAEKLWAMLGYKERLTSYSWQEIKESPVPEGQKLQHPKILFQKVEDHEIKKEKEKLLKQPVKEESLLDFKEFNKMKLRVGKILKAEKVPKSSKLLKLQVDLGEETRTIVSGIAKEYPDCTLLIGENVIVVANLKPATLMGIESQGMILAVEGAEQLQLLKANQALPGDIVR